MIGGTGLWDAGGVAVMCFHAFTVIVRRWRRLYLQPTLDLLRQTADSLGGAGSVHAAVHPGRRDFLHGKPLD